MAIVNEVSICFSISFLKYCASLNLYIVSNYWMSCDKNNSKEIHTINWSRKHIWNWHHLIKLNNICRIRTVLDTCCKLQIQCFQPNHFLEVTLKKKEIEYIKISKAYFCGIRIGPCSSLHYCIIAPSTIGYIVRWRNNAMTLKRWCKTAMTMMRWREIAMTML